MVTMVARSVAHRQPSLRYSPCWLVTAGVGAGKPVAVSTLSGHFDEVYALDWSPNGETLASGSKDRMVKM